MTQTEQINLEDNEKDKNIIKFEKPKELEEIEKEVKEKTREIVEKLANFSGKLKKYDLLSENIGNQEYFNDKIKQNKVYLNLLNNILNMMNEYEKIQKENPEFIEKQKFLAIENLNKINGKKNINKKANEYINKFTQEKLNILSGGELERLNNILEKVKKDKLLDSKELAELEYLSLKEERENKDEEENSKEDENYYQKKKEEGAEVEKKETNEELEEWGEKDEIEREEEIDLDKNKQKENEILEKIDKRLEETKEDLFLKELNLENYILNLQEQKKEYLEKYRNYCQKELSLKKEKDPVKRNDLKEELNKAKVLLDNAEKLYKKALDEYKTAYYFNEQSKKIDYLINQLSKENQFAILKERFQKIYPDLSEDQINNLVNEEINKKAYEIFNNEKKEFDKAVIGALVYNVLAKEEELLNQRLQILREEREKTSNFISKIWDRYKNLSFSQRVLLGSAVAGLSAGFLGVLGGAGFAALGIGAINAGRRLITGFTVGGGIKGISEIQISKKETEKIEAIKDKRIKEIQEEISNLLNDSEKQLKKYENYIKVMEALDERIDNVLKETENIRNRSDRSRRRWTAIALAAGGLAANADNIYNLFKGIFSPENQPGNIVGGSFEIPGEKIVPTPDVPNFPENSVPLGKGGFWEAAMELKQKFGLSNEEFAEIWTKSIVEDPISKKVYPMPKAHFIQALADNQDMFLQYDSKEKVFKAILGPKVEIGGADKLLEAYRRLGKNVPHWVMESLKKGGF